MQGSDDKALELAQLFTLVHRGTPGDVAYYVEATRGAKLVLELGCGAGRILAPIAEAGTPIVGLERSAAMIAAGRQRWLAKLPANARVLLGDMRSFDLRERFDVVIIPYNALFALDTDDDIRRTLECVRNHLVDAGRLLLDVYALEDQEPEPGGRPGAKTYVRVGTYLDQGRRIEAEECEGEELPGRRFVMRYRYRIHQPGAATRIVEDTLKHHYVPPERMLQMIRDAGFQLREVYGDFDGRSVDEDSVIRVVEAVASAAPQRTRPHTATAV